MWRIFWHSIIKIQFSFIQLICLFFFFSIFIRSENHFNSMNQNYVNLNVIFLCQEWKYVHTFKRCFNIFSDAFQFVIYEVCSIQINYPFLWLHPLFILSCKFFYVVAGITLTRLFLKCIFHPWQNCIEDAASCHRYDIWELEVWQGEIFWAPEVYRFRTSKI